MSNNCLISRNVSLVESVQNFLYEYDSSNDTSSGHKTIGGIFLNSKYAWYANGPRFEVVETRAGRKIASWTFGSILRDTTTKVNCLAEIPGFTKEIPLVILGLECSLTGGIICVFDILTSKVLRAIQVNDKVSYVHVVDCGSNIFQILGPLRAFDGVVAVGLTGGDVLLVDLCQQCIDDVRSSISTEDIKDEMDPCQIMSLTIKDVNEIESHKQRAAESGDHLAIYLNAVLNSKSPHFTLKGPKGEDRVHVNKVEVIVTSIFYCSQLGSLLVGYNFGAWQIWDIINMVLIYTSPVYEENIPVSHFTVQEPADDPRAFCYVWAVYSHTEQDNVGFPVAVLYSLSYEAKDFHEGYGYLYQNLQSCAVRFQVELSTLGTSSHTAKGACCLRLTSYNRGFSNRPSIQESYEDTLTICSLVWNVWHVNGVDTYISIFDLNQWYKAQMPSVPQENCLTYLSYICVSDVISATNNNSQLLDAYIDESSITQFLGIQKPEEHYYPTALSYEFCTCSDNNITFVYNKGQQRALLGYFETTGPLLLSKPMDIFQQALQLGLTPLFTEVIHSDLNLQREFLLNVALEHQMTAFLCKCVSTWSNGSFSCVGCSLEFFLNWCWNRVVILKTNTDKLCEPLFDYSGVTLDANNQRLLNNCIMQLSNLHRIYKFMCKKLELFELTADKVQQQEKSLHMIIIYLEVLQWLVNIGLLPEFSENARRDSKMDATGIPYPIDSLLEYYKERRSFLQSLDPSNISRRTPLLYIDHLVENKMGETLQKFWEDDGGNGFYPPPSLQSLLRTYLIEKVDLLYKHSVVIYVFLDLAMALDQSRYKFVITHLIKFPAVFKVDSSLIKVIQAFWQLDHGEFGNAIEQLSDPIINTSDLEVWHHRIILNSFLVQGHHNFALLYFQIRKPPIENSDDIVKVLRMYVLNHMIDEAINFARQYSSKDSHNELLLHVFKECEKTKQIQKLLNYPLTSKEEGIFMKFLKEISFSQLEEFQVTYYLNRSRFLDIFKMDDGKKDKNEPSGLSGQSNVSYRSTVIKNIQYCLPKVSKDIINVYQHDRDILRNEVSRPQPMSVFIHNAKQQTISKSSLIRTGILKTKEIWTHPILENSINEEVPFIGTPSLTPSISRKRPSIICSKIITSEAKTDEDYQSPRKRMRMSPRKSLIDNNSILSTSEMNTSSFLSTTQLLTPIVRRKTMRQPDFHRLTSDRINTFTPQSILKVKHSTTTPSKSFERTQEKRGDEDSSVQKNVTLVSPKGRLSYRDLTLSSQTLNEVESDPDTSSTEPSPIKTTHSTEEKTEEAIFSAVPFQPKASLSSRNILHSMREENEETASPIKTQFQSPPVLSPRRTTRSMRGRSEEPISSSNIEFESPPLLLSPRRTTRSMRGKSEEPVPSPTVQLESSLPHSPRRSSRFTREKSEEPTPSPNIQSDIPEPLSSRRISRNARGKSEEPISSSDLELPVSPRRISRATRGKSEEPMPSPNARGDSTLLLSPKRISHSIKETSESPNIQIQSPAPPSPRRTSLRLTGRKSLSRRVLENNAFSVGTPQSIPQFDHSEATNTQVLESSAGSEEFIREVTQEPLNISIKDASVGDTEQTEKNCDEDKIANAGEDSLLKPTIIIETEKEDDEMGTETARRKSFKIKSRKSLSRMVLENNTFSLSKNQSEFLGESKIQLDFNVSDVSSFGSEYFNRTVEQQKFDDIPDFSLSPMRYTSSISSDISRDPGGDDKNETEAVTENICPAQTDTLEIEKDNDKIDIEQRRKRRSSFARPENNLSLMCTSTPYHSNQNSFGEGSSIWVEKKLEALIEAQTFDIPHFSLSPENTQHSNTDLNIDENQVNISIALETLDENDEINQLQKDEDTLELKDVVSKEEEQIASHLTPENPHEELEQLVEENEKDVNISNTVEVQFEEIETKNELTSESNAEVDELNQAQLISTDVIEIIDSSTSNSDRTFQSTTDGSDISNASTFGDSSSEANYINEFSASDDASNQPCETSDEFYDANNAILVLDEECMGEEIEECNESVSEGMTEEHISSNSEDIIEAMEVDIDDHQLEKSDSDYQSVQTLKTSEENVDEVYTKPNEPTLDTEAGHLVSDQEFPEKRVEDNFEDEDLEQDSHRKEQETDEKQSVVQLDAVLHEEDSKEKISADLATLENMEDDVIVEQEDIPLDNNSFNKERIARNSDDTELEENTPEEQQDKELDQLNKQTKYASNTLHEEDNRKETQEVLQNLDEENDVKIQAPDQLCITLVEENNKVEDIKTLKDLDENDQMEEIEHSVNESDTALIKEDTSKEVNDQLKEIQTESNVNKETSVPIASNQNETDDIKSNIDEKGISAQTNISNMSEQLKESIETITAERERIKESSEDDKDLSYVYPAFDDMTIEPSNVTDVTLTDIFDLNDIDKTAYVNITVTDILEQTLPDDWNISTDHEMQSSSEEINEHKSASIPSKLINHKDTTHGVNNDKEQSIKKTKAKKEEKSTEDNKHSSKSSIESPDSIHNMKLRKRSLSSTSIKDKVNRAARKRSASVEEMSSKPEMLQSTPSTSKISPARRSKRTVSVSSLPVILEEATKSKKKGRSRNSSVEKQDEEKPIVDDIETYSTSRRLTRSQKTLLQRSKRHNTEKVMGESSLETHPEEASGLNDTDLSTSPSAVSEKAPSARISTRRTSQESVSSKASKSSRTTRKSEMGDDDDHSTISLRRSTRHRSKTPDLDVISKRVDSVKKHLSKISEEADTESKEEPPVKRGKSKKK